MEHPGFVVPDTPQDPHLQPLVEVSCAAFATLLPVRYQPVLSDARFLHGLTQYLALLARENEHMNLTADAAPDHLLVSHVRDSLVPLLLDIDPPSALLDIGSGGGFPAVPLALAWPQTAVTMVDSIGKKVRFLDCLCREIPLPRAQAVRGRVEDPATLLPAHAFDMITARGVARIAAVFRYAQPLLAKRGKLVLWKGERDLAELEDPSCSLLFRTAGYAPTVLDYHLPNIDHISKLIILHHV